MWIITETYEKPIGTRLLFDLKGIRMIKSNQLEDWTYEEIEVKGIEWQFEKIEEYSYYSKKMGKDQNWFRLFLSDWDDIFYISSGFTNAAIDLLNSLAWEKTLGKLRISVYGTPDKVVADKVWANIGIRNNGEKTHRLLSPTEKNALIEVIKNSRWETIQRDNYKLVVFLKDQFANINKKAQIDLPDLEDMPKGEEKIEILKWIKDKIKEKEGEEDLPF